MKVLHTVKNSALKRQNNAAKAGIQNHHQFIWSPQESHERAGSPIVASDGFRLSKEKTTTGTNYVKECGTI
jgi:hypothetical protein